MACAGMTFQHRLQLAPKATSAISRLNTLKHGSCGCPAGRERGRISCILDVVEMQVLHYLREGIRNEEKLDSE